MSTFDKLALGPAAVDGTAKRVIKPASPQGVWQPELKQHSKHKLSSTALPTAPIPRAAPKALHDLIGKRRGRLIIMGYAAQQGAKEQQAKWVVRCDCGNFEHRTRILRWLNTQADDMCTECQRRRYVTRGPHPAQPKAERADGKKLQRSIQP